MALETRVGFLGKNGWEKKQWHQTTFSASESSSKPQPRIEGAGFECIEGVGETLPRRTWGEANVIGEGRGGT